MEPITVITVTNFCGCEIFREECKTAQEVRNVVMALLDNTEPGDSIYFSTKD